MTEPSSNISTMPTTTALIRGFGLAAAFAVGGYFAQSNYQAFIQAMLSMAQTCCDAYHAGLAGVVGFIKGLFPFQSLSASIISLFYITLLALLGRIAYVTRRAMKTGSLAGAEQRAADSVFPFGMAFVASVLVFSLMEALTVDYPPQDGLSPAMARIFGIIVTLVFGLFIQAICYIGCLNILREKFVESSRMNWLTDFRMYVLGAMWVPSIPGISPLNIGLFAALVVLSATLEPLGDINRWLESELPDEAATE